MALTEAHRAGTVTADTPYHLVYSDRMPVARATVRAAAYLGRYASATAYTRHVMDTRGWTDLLRGTGLEAYFDLRRYQQHLFTSDVFAIELDGWRPARGVEVFRRPAANT